MDEYMKKTAFLFPGQGAQFVGMMKELAENELHAAEAFQIADRVTQKPITQLCFYGPEEALNLTENTQPCMLTAEYAALAVAKGLGLRADAYLGFSLGEWTALTAAGVISFPEALKLVCLRATAMQEAVPIGTGGMAVILGQSEQEVQLLCAEVKGYVAPSNFNCPGQISVAGSIEGIEHLLSLAENRGIVAKRIAVSIPSHCCLMKSAAEKMERALAEVEFRDPDAPIIMNCCAKAITGASEIRENIISQLTSPVRMEESINLLLDQGFECFFELGPGNTLSRFVQKCAKTKGKKIEVYSSKDKKTFLESVQMIVEAG